MSDKNSAKGGAQAIQIMDNRRERYVKPILFKSVPCVNVVA